ncbi:YkgJ family cysteine cluster protein [Paraburkholderia guartelaensis]|uniref:YkgJ family cysteine cluster protein n=1 Tax=Paraburkholderia guartelaensis TaxID=2546446 RepID=UPI002AB61D1E|nr:YkgJ family cysteine cluster protein [Paraburkholderia guartelaensis]
MDVHFGCTACGRCCANLRLPLAIDEAIQWLERGHTVELLCEAVPWPLEPASGDAMAQYKRAVTFGARSGTLPVRIGVILAATHEGSWPNLTEDKRCGVYDERPMVCRIYPAEVNPFVPFSTTAKGCPPEAWDTSLPAFARNGHWESDGLSATIERSRNAMRRDARYKDAICSALNISLAALANEGYVIHRPTAQHLLETLKRVSAGEGNDEALSDWAIASYGVSIRDTLASVGATVCDRLPGAHAGVEYLPLCASA